MDEKNPTGRNSFIVMAFTLLSRLLGIVRIRIFGSVLGASSLADAVNFSFNIPNNLRKLFAEGALSAAIVPQFSRIEDDEQRAQRLFSAFLALQILLGVLIMAAAILLRKPIVMFLSDFSDPEQNRLAIELLPFFSVFLVFILLSAYFSAVLQSRNLFLIQSFAPLLFSISVISSLLLLSDRLGPFSMAFGAVLGGFLQMVCTAVRLRSKGLRLIPDFRFRSADFRDVASRWMPAIAISAISMASTQAAFYFASSLGSGAVSAFTNSLIFWQTPYGIFFTAVSTVFFPLMSVRMGEELSASYREGLERLSGFLIPSAVFLFFFRHDAVSVLLVTGRFTLDNALMTSQVLGIFLIGMALTAWYSFTQKLCYCIGRQRKALRISVAVCVLDICFTALFIKLGLGISSLALANLIANAIGCALLFLAVRGGIGGFRLKAFALHLLKIAAGCIPMIVFCVAVKSGAAGEYLAEYWRSGSSLLNLAVFCGLAGVGISLVLAAFRMLRIKLF